MSNKVNCWTGIQTREFEKEFAAWCGTAHAVAMANGTLGLDVALKAFDGTGWRPEERLPVARELGETSIMFLVHPTLTQAEIDKTCEVIRDVMAQPVLEPRLVQP